MATWWGAWRQRRDPSQRQNRARPTAPGASTRDTTERPQQPGKQAGTLWAVFIRRENKSQRSHCPLLRPRSRKDSELVFGQPQRFSLLGWIQGAAVIEQALQARSDGGPAPPRQPGAEPRVPKEHPRQQQGWVLPWADPAAAQQGSGGDASRCLERPLSRAWEIAGRCCCRCTAPPIPRGC